MTWGSSRRTGQTKQAGRKGAQLPAAIVPVPVPQEQGVARGENAGTWWLETVAAPEGTTTTHEGTGTRLYRSCRARA